MRFIRGVALALAFTAMAAASAPPAPKPQSAFAVAMLRRDGVLVPFAVHDRGRWSAPWPAPGYRLEAPLTFEAIQRRWWGPISPATTWIAWPTGQDPRAVHVRAPVVIPAHCLSTVGLQTDYRSPEIVPPPTQHHHPKDGVATTGDQTIVPIEVLDVASPESARTLGLLMPAIEKGEARVWVGGAWLPSPVPPGGSRPGPRWEVLCRSKASPDGSDVYYFETVRELRSRPGAKPNCNGAMITQGFVLLGTKGPEKSLIFATLTDCDRAEVDFGLPLGSLTVNGRHYWIMQFSGRGRERYAIVEVGGANPRFVVDVMGGGC